MALKWFVNDFLVDSMEVLAIYLIEWYSQTSNERLFFFQLDQCRFLFVIEYFEIHWGAQFEDSFKKDRHRAF